MRFLSGWGGGGGGVYQFKAMCFRVSTAPQVFTRVFAVVSVWAIKNIQDLLWLCHSLEIVINEKSDLVPSLTANYLGITIDTGATMIFPALARVEKFLSVAEKFRALSATPTHLWQVLLGHLALLERLVPHSHLRMRSLQWHLKTHWSLPSWILLRLRCHCPWK